MPASSPLALRAIDSFHIGGRRHRVTGLPVPLRRLAQNGAPRPVDPNGDHMVGQMYVQAYRLAAPRHALPVVLWHGGGMTGTNWETTPDGRPGWLWRLLEEGFDVYVCDAPERGRSSWAMFPAIYPEPPIFRTLDEAWDMFRLGPADGYDSEPTQRRAFAGQQFPLESFDTFAMQWVPRWAGHEVMTSDAYDALLAHVGPCILMAHSQGGGFALRAAQRHADTIRAVVAVEPSGCPDAPAQPGPPHLTVWGDNIQAHPVWRAYRANVDSYLAELRAHGGTADILDLPASGVRGNTHFLMMDRNGDDVLARILTWLDATLAAPAASQ